MAKEKSDVDFTFDTTGFRNGLKSIASGIATVTKNTVNMAKNVSKGMINAVAKIGVMGLAIKGIRSALQQMPEVGKAFNIAREIIFKNFLFPIRKAIFPVLQKFLDWVRDNRGMFVKWGQTLVTIFNVVGSMIKRVIEIGKGLLTTFGDFFNRTFGIQIKGFNDLLNIISFKFAVVVEFLSRMLQPIMDIVGPVIKSLVDNITKVSKPIISIATNIIDIVTGLVTMNDNGNSLVTIFTTIMDIIGDIVTFAAELVDSFVKGLKPTLGPIVDSIQKIFDIVKDIVSKIIGGTEGLKGWKEVFQWIGGFIGEAIQIPLKAIELAFQGIAATIDFLKGAGTAVGDFFTGGGKEETVKDAIIKPDGSVIRTDPADYIIATKTPGAVAGPGIGMISIDFSGMNINVAQATTEEAVRFGETIVDQIQMQLSKELVAKGMI